MGAIEPPGLDAGEDRAQLALFLSKVQDVLGEMVYEHPGWFPEELLGLLREAFDALGPRFESAERYLNDPYDADLLDARLATAGLTGVQLELKLRGFSRALERYRAES